MRRKLKCGGKPRKKALFGIDGAAPFCICRPTFICLRPAFIVFLADNQVFYL